MLTDKDFITGGSPCECLPISDEQRLKEAIRKVYAFSGVGSALHIVLDDINVEDHHITWCIENSIPELDDPREKNACVQCALLLLKTPLEARVEIVASYGRGWR
jgi:hypothetical protein